MIRTVAVIVSAIVFTLFGMGTGLIIVLNRPVNIHDPEGFMTMAMVIAPTGGGLVAGVVVGMIAAAMCNRGGGPSGKQL